MQTYQNPIISGPYSDPSICRVGDVYYMVHSSFEYFPSIPIWRSYDLVNWEQIGHGITTSEQGLRLAAVAVSGGVQAATIRYHEGIFYITSTCVEREWPSLNYHIILKAKNPEEPWELFYLDDAPGIDSSLFFDTDGKAYFMANCIKENPAHEGDSIIWIQQIDLGQMRLVGERSLLWDGTGGNYPEGPHLYKRNDWYYLLVAEGGTLHWHTVTMARSKSITGPYVSNPRNPLLTHKHLHRSYPIQNVGHADLVETESGEWWLVCLGSRPRGGFYEGPQLEWSFGGYYRNLGRETFLVPVVWEDDFGPIIAPTTGRVEFEHRIDRAYQKAATDSVVTFKQEKLPLEFVTIRDTTMKYIHYENNCLYLQCARSGINDDSNGSIIGIRQTAWKFKQTVYIDVSEMESGDEVGIASYFNYKSHNRISFVIGENTIACQIIRTYQGKENKGAVTCAVKQVVCVELYGNDQVYYFVITSENGDIIYQSEMIDGRNVSADLNDGHTGAMIMLYATGKETSTALFKNFTYQVLER